jgi:hypothetical protein
VSAIASSDSVGTLSRQLLKYAVGCALSPAQNISFTWSDGLGDHPVHNDGILGLVPDWSLRPLTGAEQQWISACLASRSNYYGVTVIISSRGPNTQLMGNTSDDEKAGWPSREGAFWGNVYSDTPGVFSCYDASNVNHSRSKMRDCAAGHVDAQGNVVDCPVLKRLGPCATFCVQDPVTGYYTSCASDLADPSTVTDKVITTFLPL